MLAKSTLIVRAPYSWTRNGTGLGWSIAVLETGSNIGHEFLALGDTSEACYNTKGVFNFGGIITSVKSQCPGDVVSSIALGSARDCNLDHINGCGHGTHVAGIALERNTF